MEMNVRQYWEEIAVKRCEKLENSMTRRVQAVLAADDDYT